MYIISFFSVARQGSANASLPIVHYLILPDVRDDIIHVGNLFLTFKVMTT